MEDNNWELTDYENKEETMTQCC
ncbi:uncharacterized protein G2W53_027213 [Senna tora]|uniref:Uncharacterized protein n=1 Tax=Senna tora TaxID=362788 RepID=A0A834TGF0_9FABA|nr:uncharacterized protein G2W53_027213 [Senna tora]